MREAGVLSLSWVVPEMVPMSLGGGVKSDVQRAAPLMIRRSCRYPVSWLLVFNGPALPTVTLLVDTVPFTTVPDTSKTPFTKILAVAPNLVTAT